MSCTNSSSRQLHVLGIAARNAGGRASFSAGYQEELSTLATLGMLTVEPIHTSSKTGVVDVYSGTLTADGRKFLREMGGDPQVGA